MSQIPPHRPAPGTTASSSSMNTLFAGVGTATASIDNANVRSQGVDIAQLEISSNNDVGRVTRYVGQYNDTTPLAFADSATTTVASWNMGAGAEFDIGSLVRIYTTFQASTITVGTAQYGGGSAAVNADRLQQQQLFSGAGWVFWLEWDVTDNTLANFVPVPGQDDFGNHLANILDNAGAQVPHMRTAYTASTMVVPHVYCSVDGGGLGVVLNPVSGQFSNPIRRTRAYHHERTGTGTRIYGLRLMGRGVCSIGIDPAATGEGIFYVRDTALWPGAGAGTWPDYAFTNELITIDNVSFRMVVQVPQ